MCFPPAQLSFTFTAGAGASGHHMYMHMYMCMHMYMHMCMYMLCMHVAPALDVHAAVEVELGAREVGLPALVVGDAVRVVEQPREEGEEG